MSSGTSPLAEAIEVLVRAARGAVEGPGTALRNAAIEYGSEDYSADTAAAHAARLGFATAEAAWGWLFAVGDALTILAEPPSFEATYEVEIPEHLAQCGEDLRITTVPGRLQWQWRLGASPSPPPVVVPLVAVHPAGTSQFELRLKPAPLVSACTVEVEITRLGTMTSEVCTVPLDVTTQRFQGPGG